MISNAGLLRQARGEVIPQVPYIAPYLKDDFDVIRDALEAEAHIIDPFHGPISEADMNKAQRYTLAGFGIRAQRNLLVAGSGNDAQFRTFEESPLGRFTGRGSVWFESDIQASLDHGASLIERKYGRGDNPEHRWWGNAQIVYGWLAIQAFDDAGDKGVHALATEGADLGQALRSHALASVLPEFFRFVNKHVDESGERVKAAHDLSYIALMWAGLHQAEFKAVHAPLVALKGDVIVDDDGTYRFIFDKENDNRRDVYPRQKQSELPNATLKCAAHAHVPGDNTDLEYYVHAGINAAPRYNML